MVMLGDENAHFGTLSPMSTNGTPGSLHLYVDDADTVFQRALDAGAIVKYPIENAFWGDRYGKITDPFGHEWGIATRIRDMSAEEMAKAGEEWMRNASRQSRPLSEQEEVRA